MDESSQTPVASVPANLPVVQPIPVSSNIQNVPLLPAPNRTWIPVTVSIVLVIALSFYGMYLLTIHTSHVKPVKKTLVLKPSITPSPPNQLIHDGKIAYRKKEDVYLYDTNTGMSEKLALAIPASTSAGVVLTPIPISFSADGNIVYIVTYEVTEGQRTNARIYGFDVTQKNTKLLGTIDLSQIDPNPSIFAVSPLGQYVIIDTGTQPGNRGRILMTIDGKLVKELGGEGIAWSPDEKYLALATGDVQLEFPTTPPPTLTSLRVETIDNAQVTEHILVFADHQHAYQPVIWKDANTLIFEKLTYSQVINPVRDPETSAYTDGTSDEFWANVLSHPAVTFWQENIVTGEITQLVSPKSGVVADGYSYQTVSPDRVWNVYTDNTHLFVGHAGQNEKIRIDEGSSPVWQP